MHSSKGKETISILGCGWYGFALAKRLVDEGYQVKGSTTSTDKLALLTAAKIDAYLLNFAEAPPQLDLSFFDCDILIISIPPPKNTSAAYQDYPTQIDHILGLAKQQAVKQLILISSTGVYPNDNLKVDERVIPQPDTASGKVLFAAEQLVLAEKALGTTLIRFGGLIGPDRNLAKHFAGKTAIPNGLAPINLIHLDDCLGLTLALIAQKAFGYIYHGVAPDHPTRAHFYSAACRAAQLPAPEFIAELLPWKQIDSSHVPAILGYSFQIDNWDKWLLSYF